MKKFLYTLIILFNMSLPMFEISEELYTVNCMNSSESHYLLYVSVVGTVLINDDTKKYIYEQYVFDRFKNNRAPHNCGRIPGSYIIRYTEEYIKTKTDKELLKDNFAKLGYSLYITPQFQKLIAIENIINKCKK